MRKSMTCILCPLECEIHVTFGELLQLRGNLCAKGERYVRNECMQPKRMITSTIQIDHADVKRLPVMGTRPIPKEKVEEVMQIIRKIHMSAPIYAGDCILKNIGATQADLVATRTLLRKIED